MGHHFYTTDPGEVTSAVAHGGRIFEGVACYVYSVNSPSAHAPLIPIYRLYQPSSDDHLYTNDVTEYEQKSHEGYTKEGIACFAYGATDPGSFTVPFWRLYNPILNEHFYTADQNEYNTVMENGFQPDGLLCMAYNLTPLSAPIIGTIPFYRMYRP